MTISYTWTFPDHAIRVSPGPINGLDNVVVSFEVRVRAEDGATEGHPDWYAGITFADPQPDPASFIPFPADPADTPAFRDALKSWALERLDMTEADIEAAALAQLDAFKAQPVAKALP